MEPMPQASSTINNSFVGSQLKTLGNQPTAQKSATHQWDKQKSIIVLLVIVLGLLIANTFFLVNSLVLNGKPLAQQIVEEVNRKVALDPYQIPTVVELKDVGKLREANELQKTVYKDAQDGDFAVVGQDRMVIYRRSTGHLVYDGDSVTTVANKNQQQIIDDVVTELKAKSVLSADYKGTPQVQVIQDLALVKQQNPSFYTNARVNDLIVMIPESQQIILYRLDTKEIVRTGKVTSAIS